MEEMFQFEGAAEEEPIKYIAFVLDGRVEMTLGTDPRFAAILLSEPKIIEFTSQDGVQIGHLYDEATNTFLYSGTPHDISGLVIDPNHP